MLAHRQPFIMVELRLSSYLRLVSWIADLPERVGRVKWVVRASWSLKSGFPQPEVYSSRGTGALAFYFEEPTRQLERS